MKNIFLLLTYCQLKYIKHIVISFQYKRMEEVIIKYCVSCLNIDIF